MKHTNVDIHSEETLQNLAYLLDNNQNELVLNILADLHAADIADLLERIDEEYRAKILSLLDEETASEVLTELDESIREDLLENLDSTRIAQLVNEMDSDDAADLVSGLSDERATEVLSQVESEYSEDIQELLHYPEDTAGGIMAKEFVAVNANSTVEEAIEILRNKREEVENIYQCYVVDDFGKLVGAVSLKELILAKPYSRIREIMDEDVFAIRDDMDQEEVARIFEKYDLVSAPVVNSRHQLIGRITIDDIVDVIQEEAEEDIARYAGIGEEEILDESTWPIIKARIPWLIVAFFGEIVSALVMQMHQATLDQILAAAFFVPLVMAMGGSTGQQSSIIVVRGLATGEIEMRDTRRRLIREIKASVLNGLIIAAMIFTVVVIWFGTWQFALILSATLVIVILNASIFGALIPFVFKKFNIDPANATGPFVATFNDVVGLLIYFGLMTAMLNFAKAV